MSFLPSKCTYVYIQAGTRDQSRLWYCIYQLIFRPSPTTQMYVYVWAQQSVEYMNRRAQTQWKRRRTNEHSSAQPHSLWVNLKRQTRWLRIEHMRVSTVGHIMYNIQVYVYIRAEKNEEIHRRTRHIRFGDFCFELSLSNRGFSIITSHRAGRYQTWT